MSQMGPVVDNAALRIRWMEKRVQWTFLSDYVMTRDSPEWGDAIAFRVHTTDTELSPRNTAIKVWKTIG